VALVALRHRAFSDNASGGLRRGAIATVTVGLGPRATGAAHSVATLHVVRSYAAVCVGDARGRFQIGKKANLRAPVCKDAKRNVPKGKQRKECAKRNRT
jgi:hypothetical protein